MALWNYKVINKTPSSYPAVMWHSQECHSWVICVLGTYNKSCSNPILTAKTNANKDVGSYLSIRCQWNLARVISESLTVSRFLLTYLEASEIS